MGNLYLWINILAVFFPLLLSFNKVGHFYRRWKILFQSIAIMWLFVVSWDIWFASIGVWGFNSKYIIGTDFLHLPIEEWLFFLCIPYSFMFLYDQLVILNTPNYFKKIERYLDFTFIGIALCFLVIGIPKLYTTIVSTLVILFTSLIYKINPKNKGVFYMSYLVVLVPFITVNGVLTGGVTEEPIVWYNNAENLAIRCFTIPIEDFLYYFLMFEICYLAYEQIKKTTQKDSP
tara:strand:+ start:1656 stop:2351 length:696 start_codon:yes stop_codon:yes gene_type:complete